MINVPYMYNVTAYTEENSDFFPEMKSWFMNTFGEHCPDIKYIVFIHMRYRENDKYQYYAYMKNVFESIDKHFENSAIVIKSPSSQKIQREEYGLLNAFLASNENHSILLYMSEPFKKILDICFPVDERYTW